MPTYHTLHLPGWSRLLLHFWSYRAVGSDLPWPPFENNKCKVSYDFRDGGNATFTKLWIVYKSGSLPCTFIILLPCLTQYSQRPQPGSVLKWWTTAHSYDFICKEQLGEAKWVRGFPLYPGIFSIAVWVFLWLHLCQCPSVICNKLAAIRATINPIMQHKQQEVSQNPNALNLHLPFESLFITRVCKPVC